jgi:predicted RNA-binding protein
MCMARLYEAKQGGRLIVEDVARITIEDERVEVETLFGERSIFQGKVRSIDFVKSEVQLERK